VVGVDGAAAGGERLGCEGDDEAHALTSLEVAEVRGRGEGHPAQPPFENPPKTYRHHLAFFIFFNSRIFYAEGRA
jgi:hypothetical protein